VDRVLNDRGKVHPRTRAAVMETMRRLSSPLPTPSEEGRQVDVVLRVGRGLLDQLRVSWRQTGRAGQFHDMYQSADAELLEVVEELCRDPGRPLLVAARESEPLVEVLHEARSKGKRIVTVVSDLAPEARDAFVGMNNRAVGQTAAFLIGRLFGDRPTSVGVVIGDHAYRCHADREIGFRTTLRAHFPKIVVAGEALGEDNPTITESATARLLQDWPAIAAIYNIGAGNVGLVRALRAAGRAEDILLVSQEVNAVTAPLLREEGLDFAIATNPAVLLSEALRVAESEEVGAGRDGVLLDCGVYTRFNLPGFWNAATHDSTS
jgi:LacI family transcriptional regulator